MAQRSELVSLALVMIPNIVLFSFRTLSPDLNDALSNDDLGQTVAHSLALFIGLIMAYRYSVVHDHEYRRSKAINSLSKTYKLEDRGLWEKGDLAIQKLEARAHSDFKGRKAIVSRRRMQGKIGEMNRESFELEQEMGADSGFTVTVDGVEQEKEIIEESEQEKIGIIYRISNFFSNSIEKAAIKRNERRKKEETRKIEAFSAFEEVADSTWSIPQGTLRKTRLCASCSTYNEAESDYCSSCGSLIA